MKDISEKIQEELKKGHESKEIARKSTNNLDEYLKAADHFKNAAKFSSGYLQTVDQESCKSLQADVFRNYYLCEQNNCLAVYFYEKRDFDKAFKHFEDSLISIRDAINLVNENKEICETEIRKHLESFIPGWVYMKTSLEAQDFGARGRKFWNENKPIEAIDNYRKASHYFEKSIELAQKKDVDPAFERIAVGNFIGMNANIASSLAKHQLSKGKKSNGNHIFKNDDEIIELIRHTLKAANLARDAYENNPEWQQYKDGAIHMEKVVSDILDDITNWTPFYSYFESDEHVKRIMKKTDLSKYKKAKSDLDPLRNKYTKIWQFGSFFIFAFLIISTVIYVFASAGLDWKITVFSLIAIEVFLLIIGAFTLRVSNDLSETNFMELIRLAVRLQFDTLVKFFESRKQ